MTAGVHASTKKKKRKETEKEERVGIENNTKVPKLYSKIK